jgi:Fic family protein
MLDTLDEPLSQELIKRFHYELKSGVFEDRANGYAIGDYKQRPNMIGMYQTVRPENVAQEMYLLTDWYNDQEVDFSVLAGFHARYESIHPFQDGNGRTGRLILFRECLKNGIVPVVIEDANKNEYLEALKEYREERSLNLLISLFEKEQQFYFEKCKYFM